MLKVNSSNTVCRRGFIFKTENIFWTRAEITVTVIGTLRITVSNMDCTMNLPRKISKKADIVINWGA